MGPIAYIQGPQQQRHTSLVKAVFATILSQHFCPNYLLACCLSEKMKNDFVYHEAKHEETQESLCIFTGSWIFYFNIPIYFLSHT